MSPVQRRQALVHAGRRALHSYINARCAKPFNNGGSCPRGLTDQYRVCSWFGACSLPGWSGGFVVAARFTDRALPSSAFLVSRRCTCSSGLARLSAFWSFTEVAARKIAYAFSSAFFDTPGLARILLQRRVALQPLATSTSSLEIELIVVLLRQASSG